MTMRLLYITNDPVVGRIAERAGVDWIFVDMEYRGKAARQANRDTVISAHTLEDVRAMRRAISTSQLIVRVNPWGNWSPAEIQNVVHAGADIVMLPYFNTATEVAAFLNCVGGNAKTCLLLETLAGIEALDEILTLPGIDYVHVGLNDLHIQRKTAFMFEFLSDGALDAIAVKLRAAGVSFGFGGIARIGTLLPPAEQILAEHVRVGSTAVILSRSFCHPSEAQGCAAFEEAFKEEVNKIRLEEVRLAQAAPTFFKRNRQRVIDAVNEVVRQIREEQN